MLPSLKRACLVLATLLPLGCFDGSFDPGGVPAPSSLEVHDAQGGRWPADRLPRHPTLVLRFPEPPRVEPGRRLFLVTDHADADLLADLATPPLRQETTARLRALGIELEGEALRARPEQPLAPASAYTLVWLAEAGPTALSLRTSASPAAGAALVQTLPADQDARVAPNLSGLLLRFDGYVRGDVGAALSLRAHDDEAVPARVEQLPCRQQGLPGADCVWLHPDSALAPDSAYTLALRDGLYDATGAAILPQSVVFRTAPAPDRTPPAPGASACAVDEQSLGRLCLLAGDRFVSLRGTFHEAALVSLALPPDVFSAIDSGRGFLLQTGAIDSAQAGLLRVRDLAGNVYEQRLAIAPALDLPTLSIDELCPDPRGPEPAQEYVELLNFGAQPVQVAGFSLDQDPHATGGLPFPALDVLPGERILVVGPHYDPDDPADAAPAEGVRLLRLGRALALPNSGAPLFLRDDRGRRLSAAPDLPARMAGQCIVRTSDDPRAGTGSDFAYDPHGGCSPGTATRPPDP